MLPRLLLVLTVLIASLVPATAIAEPTSPPSSFGPALPWVGPLPRDPVVTRPFEPPPHPYGAGHRGVDLAGTAGAAVVAAGDGVVVFAGMVAGRPLLSIDHAGGLRTTYEPVDPSVGAGQPVGRGSPVGTLVSGHGGCPVEACLHWGARRGGTYLDPLTLLRPQRVRLLPMGRPARRWAAAGHGPDRPARRGTPGDAGDRRSG